MRADDPVSFKKRANLFHTMDGAKEVFIPWSPKSLKHGDILRYLQNIEWEISEGLFCQDEVRLLQDALYGKFLDKNIRRFFLYHFLPIWESTINMVFETNAHPKIIELGCGTGTSSLLFAFLGASVIGIELNRKLVDICQKRKGFYERHIGSINANFYEGNTLEFSYESHAPVDAFFSLFAFNLMKPSDDLLGRMIPSLKREGRIIIIDGNQSSFYNRLIPSRRKPGVLNPIVMKNKLKELGCRILAVETHCAIPPFIFRIPGIIGIALRIENVIKAIHLHRFFGVSYTVVAEKIR